MHKARPEALVGVLKTFLEYQPPAIADWEKASVEFKDKVPEIAGALVTAIRKEHKANAGFRAAFADFVRLAKALLLKQNRQLLWTQLIGNAPRKNLRFKKSPWKTLFKKAF